VNRHEQSMMMMMMMLDTRKEPRPTTTTLDIENDPVTNRIVDIDPVLSTMSQSELLEALGTRLAL
jgi:hypothetical protein